MSLFELLKQEAGIILSGQTGAKATSTGQPVEADALMGGILDMLKQQGVGPLLQQLQAKGLGEAVASWVGKGENLPVTAEQLQHGIGQEAIGMLATRLGLPPDRVSALLAQVLPKVVDKLTPHGSIEPESLPPGS